MKPNYPFFLLCFMLSIVLLPDRSQAANLDQSTIIVNGTPVNTASFIQKGRTMVHSKFFEQAGAAVSWNNKTKSVALKRNGMLLSFPSGSKVADYFVRERGKWQRDFLAVPTVNQNGKTYIPLRYAVQKLGMTISYNPQNSLVSIQFPISASRSSQAKEDRDLYWLYQITEAEAGGESHEGKVAVAASVLNRVKSPDWPNTIKDVIFQVTHKNGAAQYQFSPVANKLIYSATPSSDTIKAVQEAAKGSDPTGGATLFYNPKKSSNEWIRSKTVTATIGNHVFAK